jgi:hypothetical protein
MTSKAMQKVPVKNGGVTHTDVRNTLIVDRFFTVSEQGTAICISKIFNSRPMTLTLNCSGGRLHIEPPRYTFKCSVSYFEYKQQERRFSRDKSMLRKFIERLRRLGIWDYVSNQDFFDVNNDNKKLNRNKALKEMKLIKG